nr:DegV family protein [Anaerolineae bacterium]
MSNNHKTALVTDSTCNIPKRFVDQYDIVVVPLYVIWGDDTLQDGIDIDNHAFYERLQSDPVHPKTSQPTPKDFIDTFNQLKSDGFDEIVVIAISEKLSGTLESARQAAAFVDSNIHLLDSRSVSMGSGWQVLAAARAREAGGSTQDMLAAAEAVRRNHSVIFTVDTLDYLHKGGRIGGAAKLVGTALKLKPQLYVDSETGTIEPGERVRTRSKSLESIYSVFFSSINTPPLHIAILHINAEEEARQLATRIKQEHNPAEIFITDTSPVIGIHGGPGTIGIVGYSE